ncbi:MAG: DNA polymerase III subunit gamma/tau [Vicinamibacteria bacterium]|nr:DNA polymerase III subunit gamma/tau [Vicinamibacteria bacterium]
MSYLVLARKWRPKSFDDVVGQATVTRTLKNALKTGRIGHAFLFTGARGVGKTTMARILARALNCAQGEQPTPEPCGTCPACEEIIAGTSLDVQEIDGATHNGVEQVRELRESARYNPARDRFKIWIIDEVHMLSTGAFNALLKTLEEPPPRVKFIFATTEYHKIPDTILSRCQQYDFRLIPAAELHQHLRKVAEGEQIEVSDDTLARIARAAEGSARDALSLFDQILSFSGERVRDEDVQALLGLIDRELLLRTSRAIADQSNLALFELVESLSEFGIDLRHFVRELTLHFREILLVKTAPRDHGLLAQVAAEEQGRLAQLAQAFSEDDLLRILDALIKADAELRWAQDPRVTLEIALLKLAQLQRLLPLAELIARAERSGGGPATTAAPPPAPGAALRTPAPPAPKRQTAAEGNVSVAAKAASAPSSLAKAESADEILSGMIACAQGRPSLLPVLRQARGRMERGIFTMTVPADIIAVAEMHLEEYGQFLKQVVPTKMELRIEAGEPSLTDATAAPSAQKKALEKAAAEPAVQEAMKLFDAKIVDVQ